MYANPLIGVSATSLFDRHDEVFVWRCSETSRLEIFHLGIKASRDILIKEQTKDQLFDEQATLYSDT